MNFAFAGTPLFASLVLRELVELGRTPSIVISQPDRPCGRGRSAAAPPAAVEATCQGVECLQSDDINSSEIAEKLKSRGVSTLVVAAFGQLMKRSLLESFTCVNVHASLLPRYRGAAPIERALMEGERTTGVTIMRITECLDEGPWAEQVEISLGLREDAGCVSRMLATAGAVALSGVLDAIEDGSVRWLEQEGESVYAHKLGTAECQLDLRGTALEAHNQVRALSPGIGARVRLGESEAKVWRSWPYGVAGVEDCPAMANGLTGNVGGILIADGRLFLGCGQGVLEVKEIQPASRARMRTTDYLRGYSDRVGDRVRSDASCGPTENV